MTNETQDVVSSIQGADILRHKTEEIFQSRQKNIVELENGFQIHSDGLPYYFQLSCFEEIGWNVFLSSISGKIEDDEETDVLYHQLEDAVDVVNSAFFYDELEDNAIPYSFFKLKSVVTEKGNNLPEIVEIKDTGKYVLKVFFEKLKDFPLEIGYSMPSKRWYYEFHSQDAKESLAQNQVIRDYMEELDYMVGNLNQSM